MICASFIFLCSFSKNCTQLLYLPGNKFRTCYEKEKITINTYRFDNDGILIAESAGNWPNTQAIELAGTNHQSKNNDPNTKRTLIDLFDGRHGDFFKTEEK